jgi:hypothetical protein
MGTRNWFRGTCPLDYHSSLGARETERERGREARPTLVGFDDLKTVVMKSCSVLFQRRLEVTRRYGGTCQYSRKARH